MTDEQQIQRDNRRGQILILFIIAVLSAWITYIVLRIFQQIPDLVWLI